MKKLAILIFLSCCISQNIRAQQQEIDSLKQLLQTRQHDTLRVIQLNKLGYLYHTSKPDTTLILAQEAIALAQQTGFIQGEARGLSILGAALYITGNYPKALDLFLSSLKIYEDINDLEGIGNSTGNIANIHLAMGHHSQSLDYYFKTLGIFKKLNNKIYISLALSSIGEVYLDQKILDSARSYTLQAYDIALGEQDNWMSRITSNQLGEIYAQMEQPGMAMEFYHTGFEENTKDNLTSAAALGIAQIFWNRNQQDSSLYYAKHSYGIAENLGFTQEFFNASAFLAEYYESIQKYDSAYAYLSISLAAKDSLYNQEKANKVQALAMEETLRQKKKEEVLLEIEEKQKLNLQYIAIAGGIILFTILFILLSRSIIVNEKWIGFMGILMLLIVFEFINLLLTTQVAEITNYNPIWTLIIMVGVAALLIPLHHKIEQHVTKKMTKKNRKIRVAAARKTLKELEMEEQD